ncbi:hypothetical protein [Nocardia sp. NPDC019395]|uniref:hypothetical protein n=1 Tax=Nocardia sp. NPDC019395 TaxID=3154686 RepID=UPI0033D109EA
MVHIVSLDEVDSIVGSIAPATSLLTGDVSTVAESLTMDSKAGSSLDAVSRTMCSHLDWIQDTVAAKVTEVTDQTETTVHAADYGTAVYHNTDVDGGGVVRSASV